MKLPARIPFHIDRSLPILLSGFTVLALSAWAAVSQGTFAPQTHVSGKNLSGGSQHPDFSVFRMERSEGGDDLLVMSPGDLDTTFGSGGLMVTQITPDNDTLAAMELQSDGKIVVAGTYNAAGNTDAVLARYNPDGSLDTSFDGDGIKILTYMGQEAGRALAMQPDGKILLAVHTYSGPFSNSGLVVARFNSDGSPDTTFDGDGHVLTNVGVFFAVNCVIVQTDGKIVVAGGMGDGVDYNSFYYRYNTDGSLDPTFDGDGKVLVEASPHDDGVSGLAIQPDGKIVSGGFGIVERQPNVLDDDYIVIRLNPDGSRDTTFDGDGIVFTPIGPNLDRATGMTLQPDGKIILAGFTQDQTFNWDFAIVRYNSNGSLDTSFDGDGKLVTPVGSGRDVANKVRLQTNNKIVAGGYSNNGSNDDFSVIRLNSDGSFDPTFSGDGKVLTPVGSAGDSAQDIAIQPDGKIILAGVSRQGTDDAFALARYLGEDAPPTPTPTPPPTPTPTPSPTPPVTVSVSGRVTTPTGLGLRNAVVSLTNSVGVRQTATTSSFGIYNFAGINPGETYILSVSSRRYRFTPQTIPINGNMTNVDFVGLE